MNFKNASIDIIATLIIIESFPQLVLILDFVG